MQRRLTVRDLRAGNRARVLRTLYFDQPRSRQELAVATGLSQASVSTVVGELLAEGLVVEAGQVESDGGRPRVLLRVNPGFAAVVGVDVGETHVLVEVFDLTLERLAESRSPVPAGGCSPDEVARLVLAGLDRCLAASGVTDVLGVGVGVPGLVEDGLVYAQTVGWHAAPLERLLRAGTGLPLFLDNGANTLGQAESWFGAGRGVPDVVVALIGSGVGASVILGGVPYRGASGGAGEWGHTTVALDGRPCRCGAAGCLEAYLGAAGIVQRYRELDPSVPDDEEAALRALVADDSTGAAAILAATARFAGLGIGNLINLVNPAAVVLGGWAGLVLGERLLGPIRREAARHALHRPFEQVSIGLCELGPESVALGAATLPVAALLESGGVRRRTG
ncbi:ROK family transcriptional regulator [Actinosynnema sp. NPDC047251]|uniref:Transcriptional regulator, ROK family n=1 Tax=Saccharothrix espanaensis (strain ATCC 51144 / DSM 44229 / JCM 9112 / NBRC 15066 / NRRL 15764) TaxID=1179773 RepID=K0JR79_SACES|nr:ROK family transcriptional regulator [Saccharothrix espanaensis]CCH28281.1 Transcriptional regulator, ROK family [Saccharothrix espanaensis DSM 44229]